MSFRAAVACSAQKVILKVNVQLQIADSAQSDGASMRQTPLLMGNLHLQEIIYGYLSDHRGLLLRTLKLVEHRLERQQRVQLKTFYSN